MIFEKVAYNGDATILKPIMVRGARISETTIKDYGKTYTFQTVISTKIDQTSIMMLKDKIVRYVFIETYTGLQHFAIPASH